MQANFVKLLAFLTGAVLALACASSQACIGDERAARSYSVHVVPQLPPAATFALWAPLLERVGKKAGLCFELTVPESITAFESILWAGKTDFAFANPYHEVVAYKRQGYVPLLMDSRARLSGLLVVRSDSTVRSVQDLHGREVGFPSPNAFAASLLIRGELARKGIHISPKYLKTHGNVYRAVVTGDVVAGGGVNNTLQREDAGLRQSMKVIYETGSYAPHPVVAHPRVPVRVREQFQTVMLALSEDAAGRALLDGVQMPEPVRSDYKRDFLPLEKLGLERWVVVYED